MIADKELSDLFKAESEEHLQHLDEGLLRLEATPHDQAALEEVFREAHSLKGSARMLGVHDVEMLAHRFEDILGAAKRGKTVLAAATIDRLSRGLDAMRRLVHEAVTGESAGVKVPSVLAQLSEEDAAATLQATPLARREAAPQGMADVISSDMTTDSPGAETTEAHVQEEPLAQDAAAPPAGEDGHVPSTRYRIETIRVEPQKLDALMTQAGELTVTKLRIAGRLAEMEDIMALWEEWSRDASAHHVLVSAARPEQSRTDERHPSHGAVKGLHNVHERERERLERLGILLSRLSIGTYEDHARLEFVANELAEGIRTIRLIPLSTIFNLFPRMVRDLAREQAKEVQLLIEGGETTADKLILEEMKDPLMHMIRNAIDHGIEMPEERARSGKSRTASIQLRAYQTATNIVMEIVDDGRGLDLEAIKRTALKRRICREDELAAMTPAQIQSLIFASGFSTSPLVTDVSGRGVGLDVVRTNVERLKGTIQVDSSPGLGCRFRIHLPITLATVRVLIVAVHRRTYALPVEFVQTMRLVSQREIFAIEGRETIVLDGRPVSVARLSELLELRVAEDRLQSSHKSESAWLPCVILSVGGEQLGLFVDTLLDEQEVVLKPPSAILKRVRNVSGATILGTGEVCMVLHPHDLMKTVQRRAAPVMPARPVEARERQQTILLVEDSITTRTQEKRILEGAGYAVVTAVDGADALNKLSARSFDAVVSDIQMPNIDGLTLTARIRQDKKYTELPIILVTSLATEEDKKKGIEVGANAYITKPTFDQKVLLDTLRRLV